MAFMSQFTKIIPNILIFNKFFKGDYGERIYNYCRHLCKRNS